MAIFYPQAAVKMADPVFWNP